MPTLRSDSAKVPSPSSDASHASHENHPLTLTENEDATEGKYLLFRLGEAEYLIAIRFLREVVVMQSITPVPHVLPHIKGVINLRGQVIPVVDLRARLRMPLRSYDDRTCVIIARLRGLMIGIVVDTICEVVSIPPDAISPPPTVQRGIEGRFVGGIGRFGEKDRMLLDLERLLFDDALGSPSAANDSPPAAG